MKRAQARRDAGIRAEVKLMSAIPSGSYELQILMAAREIGSRGQELGLPLVAACADISSGRPLSINGMPIGAMFEFAADAREYWRQSDFALQNPVVSIIRWTAEPFYYDNGVIGSWRPIHIAPELARQTDCAKSVIRGAIVAPVHLPGSIIGAVVWATDQSDVPVRDLFDTHAADLHVMALRFISSCNAAAHGEPVVRSYKLTRREIQCLKLAAAGKTDEEIGMILTLAVPTVRFHLKNAGAKLGENGRIRIVQHASALGFVSTKL
jgi:DNA-binding CsgD family transcriptional regulator